MGVGPKLDLVGAFLHVKRDVADVAHCSLN